MLIGILADVKAKVVSSLFASTVSCFIYSPSTRVLHGARVLMGASSFIARHYRPKFTQAPTVNVG